MYREYTPELEIEFNQYKTHIMSGTDSGTDAGDKSGSGHHDKSGFGQLMTKLNRALAADAFYDEQVMK